MTDLPLFASLAYAAVGYLLSQVSFGMYELADAYPLADARPVSV